MASVHELLGTQNMVRMSSSVHVVEDIHLQKDQSETRPCVHHDTFYIVCIPVHHVPSMHAQTPICACIDLVPQQ